LGSAVDRLTRQAAGHAFLLEEKRKERGACSRGVWPMLTPHSLQSKARPRGGSTQVLGTPSFGGVAVLQLSLHAKESIHQRVGCPSVRPLHTVVAMPRSVRRTSHMCSRRWYCATDDKQTYRIAVSAKPWHPLLIVHLVWQSAVRYELSATSKPPF
jgi:hypothetical protein